MLESRGWAVTWSVLRLAMAIAIVAAVAVQLHASLTTAAELGKDVATTAANFFSFFTILSNIGTAIVLTWAALWLLTRGRRTDAGESEFSTAVEPRTVAVAVASVTTYMVITGIVYNTLLRSIPLDVGSQPVPWSNEVMHLIGPIFLLADLAFAPARRALRWRAVWVVIAFPIVWVVYTLVRGPLVTDPGGAPAYWYPYPFLSPHNFDNGYVTVSLYIVGIAVAIIAVALVVVWVGRRRGPASAATSR